MQKELQLRIGRAFYRVGELEGGIKLHVSVGNSDQDGFGADRNTILLVYLQKFRYIAHKFLCSILDIIASKQVSLYVFLRVNLNQNFRIFFELVFLYSDMPVARLI